MSLFPSIPSAEITLPAIAVGMTVQPRTWSLQMPERPFTEEGFEALVRALFSTGCKWPVGDPGEADYCVCGEPKASKDYCAAHVRASKYRGRHARQ